MNVEIIDLRDGKKKVMAVRFAKILCRLNKAKPATDEDAIDMGLAGPFNEQEPFVPNPEPLPKRRGRPPKSKSAD